MSLWPSFDGCLQADQLARARSYLALYDSPGDVVEVMVRVVALVVRRAERVRAVHDARVRADIPERREPRVPIEHPIPDTRELGERDVQLRTIVTVTGRVDALVEVVKPREYRLDEGVSSRGVRATTVDVGDEEGTRIRWGGSEDTDLLKDDFCGGVKVSCAVSC